MKKTACYTILLGALLGLVILSCGEDTPTGTGGGTPPDDAARLPAIPIPDSPDAILPARSAEVNVGLSRPIDDFRPVVESLETMKDDGSTVWNDENRRLWMVCGGLRAHYSCAPDVMDKGYMAESPRFLHKRYWKRIKQVILDPGTSYSKTETIEYGSSTTDTHSQSFSQTISVEVSASAGWGAFSATVSSKYEQTSTWEETRSVTFSETSTFEEVYAVESDPQKTIVYGLWQLVDVFVLTDSDKVPIDQSDALGHVLISEVPRLEFLNRDVVRQSVTKFDAPSTQ